MKIRVIIIILLLIVSLLFIKLDFNVRTSGQQSLENDTPILDDSPYPDDYEYEVLPGEFAVVGIRPRTGDDYDIEVYTDTTYSTLIDSSNTAGDVVDFVVLDKDVWTSPPERGVKVTSGTTGYAIEMENNIDIHSVFDSWNGSMNETPGNPVLDFGAPGSWDSGYVAHPTVIHLNGTYHMWFSGGDGSPYFRTGYANSSDGITWNKYEFNPVLYEGSPGDWDDLRAFSPMVLFDGSLYHMWYTGYDGVNFRIGYANSTNGIDWTKYDDPTTTTPAYNESDPVLNIDLSPAWDDTRVYAPSVTYDGVIFHMWYSGYDGLNYRIGYANSTDGINWIKHPTNPIINPGPPGTWDNLRVFAPSVVYTDSKYVMCYNGYDGSTYRIGYAMSENGINWIKSPANPVLNVGISGAWDDTHVHSPTIFFNNSRYYMWYSGENGPNSRIGYAILPDIDHWEKYSGNPVIDLGDPSDWDDVLVQSPTVIFNGTTYHMWYSGNDGFNWRIGYATSTDGINWIKYFGNPVLDLGSDWWEDAGVLEPFVLYDGAIYHMWYSGDDSSTTRRICYANSTDGIVWNRYAGNPVLDIGAPGEWDDDSVYADTVIYNGSAYQMWYTGDDGPRHRIGYATSSDGLIWLKYDNTSTTSPPYADSDPVMDLGSSGSWEDEHVYRPRILYDGSEYKLWYGGGDGTVIKTGYATSMDGINWQRYAGNPVIDNGPPGTFDDTHTTPSAIYYDGVTYHNWYTSYDGSTYRIGYAKITFSKYEKFSEVLDAYEITGVNAGSNYTIDLDVPPSLDLDLFIYDSTGGRNDAVAFSDGVGTGIDESISFTAPASGDYLLLITNENGGVGTYTISFNETPPIIANVRAVPDPQEVYGSVTISANITAYNELFGAWVEIYDPLGGFVGNMTLLFDSINGKFYWVQNYNIIGTYSFIIWASDTSDNWASVPGSFVIWDTTAPIISAITAIPNPQEVFFSVNVSANITDNYQMGGAWVQIFDPDGIFIGNYTMYNNTVDLRYYYNRSYDILGIYTFTIWASDTSDNWASAPGSFVVHDTTAPIISAITAIPNPQEVFFSVNVSANITDNNRMGGAWVQIFDPDGIFIGNFTMYENTVDLRYYYNRSYDTIGTYSFTIWANDTSNNWASAPGSFVIWDITPPEITDVIANPDPQEVFLPLNISAIVTDNYQLSRVWIEIDFPSGNPLGNLSMLYDSTNDRYYLERTYNVIGEYSFTIWANDTSDNWVLEMGTFIIQDTEPPIIMDVMANPDPQEVYDDVLISAKISDNYQLDGEWVEVYDPDGVYVGNFSMSYDSLNDRFYHEQSYDLLGKYTFTVWAKDVVNNWAFKSGSFSIRDTTPPIISDPITIPDPQEVHGSINISATITDNYELYGGWIEVYDPDGDFIGNYTMSNNSISDKYYWEGTSDIIGDYSFAIWANDTQDNWVSYQGTFSIQDTEAPVIMDATAVPNPQDVFGAVNISSNVTDNFELSETWIEIRDPNDELVGIYAMDFDLDTSRYHLIRSCNLIGLYSYTIWANDTSENLVSVSGSFLIQDTTPPIITDLVVDPKIQIIQKGIHISANITDNYQLGGVWVEVYSMNDNITTNFSMIYDSVNDRYFLYQTYESLGDYTFVIWANDTSNNWASSSGSFEIKPKEEPEEYNWKPIIAFIFAIILLIIGIIIVMIKPMKFTGDLGKDRMYSFFAGVLPFVFTEAITGLVSLITGLMAVPPILGLGMIVDLGTLIAGIVSCIVIYVKGVPSKSYKEEITPPSTAPQPPELTSQLEGPKTPLPAPESPSPSHSPETPPPLPVPEPEEEQPLLPPPEPEKEPPSPAFL